MLRKLTWCVAVLSLAACAPSIDEEDLSVMPMAPPQESVLVVQNNNWTEMVIYAVMGSTRMRIGSVLAGRTAELRLSRALLDRPEIVLQADPVGPDNPFTFPPIQVRAGRRVEMFVAPNLLSSMYSCANCRQ